MEVNLHSKLTIKQRMYRHAAEFWGIKSIEDLDPLVRLLIEALASEIYNIQHNVRAGKGTSGSGIMLVKEGQNQYDCCWRRGNNY